MLGANQRGPSLRPAPGAAVTSPWTPPHQALARNSAWVVTWTVRVVLGVSAVAWAWLPWPGGWWYPERMDLPCACFALANALALWLAGRER